MSRAASIPQDEGRPFYSRQHIEKRATEELKTHGLLPEAPAPIRIFRYVEKRFGVAVEFEDLADGLLGYTRFAGQKVDAIVVSRTLTNETSAVAERRINTTVAHEAGHGLLHAELLRDWSRQSQLFKGLDDVVDGQILCRDVPVPGGREHRGSWLEYQANMMMGALLLPRDLVVTALGKYLQFEGLLGIPRLDPSDSEQAARDLADVFDVNLVVGRIRIRGFSRVMMTTS